MKRTIITISGIMLIILLLLTLIKFNKKILINEQILFIEEVIYNGTNSRSYDNRVYMQH